MYNVAHVGVVVSDMERSVKYYCEVFGCCIRNRYQDERIHITYLDAGSTVIELLFYPAMKGQERGTGIIDHIAFYVESMDEVIERIEKLGLKKIFDAPREMEGEIIMFIEGPDGERLEFVQKKKI